MIETTVTCATSFDIRFDPQNVLNDQHDQIWITTGMFPQELTITFDEPRVINEVKFISTGIRKVFIRGCTSMSGNGFNKIGESAEIQNMQG